MRVITCYIRDLVELVSNPHVFCAQFAENLVTILEQFVGRKIQSPNNEEISRNGEEREF